MPDIPLSAHSAAARLAQQYADSSDDDEQLTILETIAEGDLIYVEALLSSWWEMREALRKAEQLAEVARDWNLDDVEINGAMVPTLDLADEFRALLVRTDPENTEDADAK